jgi:hypothetical protein
MAESSTNGGSGGFFGYYRKYAKTGIHAASAAALTAFGLWASFTGNRWFILLAIAVYVLPPVFLYLTGEGENVPSVVGETDTEADTGRNAADVGETSHDREFEDDADRADSRSDSGGRTPESANRTNAANGRDSDEPSADSDDLGTPNAASMTDVDDAEDRPDDAAGESTSGVGENANDESASEPGWSDIDTPTDQSLLDVVATSAGAYAVGEAGVVLARDGGDWTVALDDGPTANANALRGVDATADHQGVWFAGDSGVLGRYADGKLTDHSAPEDQTSTWEDVAVTGDSGGERIHLVNGSGELLRGTYEDGAVSWGDIEKPGSGSSISSIEFRDADRGHICDTNQSVYETTNGGESYEEIGIEDANAAFTDIATTDAETVVAADDGSLFRYDGAVWTRLRPSESALSAIDLVGETGLAAGDGGAVYELMNESWESAETPTDADLRGIAIGERVAVAVGTDGTAIERRR